MPYAGERVRTRENRVGRHSRWRQLQVRRGKLGPGSDQPLFLHYKGRPYKPNGVAWGTQNKTAFNNAKRRAVATAGKRYDDAIAAMRAAGDINEVDRLLRLKSDDLKLLASITQHWLRHKFATDTGRKDLRPFDLPCEVIELCTDSAVVFACRLTGSGALCAVETFRLFFQSRRSCLWPRLSRRSRQARRRIAGPDHVGGGDREIRQLWQRSRSVRQQAPLLSGIE
jgi:hypothetical protein